MTEKTVEANDFARIKPRDPDMAAAAEKLFVLAVAESNVTAGRRWAMVENHWGIVQAMGVDVLEPWPAGEA